MWKENKEALSQIPVKLSKYHFSKKKYFIKKAINSVYFEENSSFAEMDKFISDNVDSFNLSLVTFSKDYSQISKLISSHNLKAIILGTRRTDPHCCKYIKKKKKKIKKKI